VIRRRLFPGASPPVPVVVLALAGALVLAPGLLASSSHRGPSSTTTVAPLAVSVVPDTVPSAAPLPVALHASNRPSACPTTRPDAFPQTGVARLDIALVAIAPVTAEVCVYGGPGAHALQSRVAFAGVAASTVVNALNTVAGIDPVSGPRCEPGPNAPVVVMVSDGLRTEALSVALTGCHGVNNGLLSGAGTPSSIRMVTGAVALAGRCRQRFGRASCIAGSP